MTCRRTTRQRNGAAAEDLAAAHLVEAGWTVLARNVRVGRDEIDIVALDPGPPPVLVAVEVRSLRDARFGAPEERVDHRKVARLYRALAALRASRSVAGTSHLAWRVDLVVVDRRPGRTDMRHLRAVEPP